MVMEAAIFPDLDPMLGLLYAVLGLYVGVSLTIPLWVPILQKLTGQCGVFWVHSRQRCAAPLPESTPRALRRG